MCKDIDNDILRIKLYRLGYAKLENFFAKIEAKLVAFLLQFFGQLGRAAVKYGYLSFVFIN